MSLVITFSIKDLSYVIVADASVREQHSGSAQTTDHQVEKSADGNSTDITDHIRPLPDRFMVEGIITNTPIVTGLSAAGKNVPIGLAPSNNFAGALQPQNNGFTKNGTPIDSTLALQFQSEFDRVNDVYKAFSDAKSFGALLTIYTSLRSYDNMVIETFDVPRDVENSNILRFSLQTKNIRFAQTQEVTTRAPQRTHKGAKAANKDNDKTKEQKSGVVQESSLVNQIFGG